MGPIKRNLPERSWDPSGRKKRRITDPRTIKRASLRAWRGLDLYGDPFSRIDRG
jgi:hypothetical protein